LTQTDNVLVVLYRNSYQKIYTLSSTVSCNINSYPYDFGTERQYTNITGVAIIRFMPLSNSVPYNINSYPYNFGTERQCMVTIVQE
jgi:hypothetical protein